jgi:hypothetical protein
LFDSLRDWRVLVDLERPICGVPIP